MWILSQGKISKYGNDGKPERFAGTHTDALMLIQPLPLSLCITIPPGIRIPAKPTAVHTSS